MDQIDNAIPNRDKNIKVIRNYIFNAIYQVFLIIVPLITMPYISRVLSPDGIGMYSYSFSLITYFTLASGLGIPMYAQREIAKHQDDKQIQSKIFWEMFILRSVSSGICIIINLLLCGLGIYGRYQSLMIVLTINIIAVVFDISYLFQGNEKFGIIALSNALIKAVGVAMIFVLVKTRDDLWKYVLINSLIVLFSSLCLWLRIGKHISKVKIKELKPFSHLPAVILLFLPTIVISIYTVLDKTLIGVILNNDSENGFYEQSERIVKMVITIITSISTVMMSRNATEYSKGNIENVKNNIYNTVKFVWFLGTPLMLGIIAVARNLNYWFFGPGYEPVINLMIVFSPIILALSFNNIFGVQYLIAIGKDKKFTISVVIGAVMNFILNIILIKTIGTVGAVIASVVSETSILVIQLIMVRKDFSILKMLLLGWKNIIGSLIMFVVLYLSYRNFESTIVNTILYGVTGIIIYFVLMLVLRDELLYKFLRIIINKIKSITTQKQGKKKS